MPVPFLLKVHSDDPAAARAVADALRDALASQGARFSVETGPRGLPGVCVSVGLWDAMGKPRWLAPLEADGEPRAAVRGVVAFLESWGFVARGVSAGAGSARAS